MLNDIIQVLMYYLTDFIKLWLMLWGIMNFPMKKGKRIYLITGAFVSILLITASMEFEQYKDMMSNLMTLLVIITMCFIISGRFIKKISYTLLGYIGVLLIDLSVTGIISLILNSTIKDFNYDPILLNLVNSLGIPILGMIAFVLKTRRKAQFPISLSRRIYALLFAGAGTGTLFIGGLMVSNFPGANEKVRRFLLVITIIACFAYCAACLMLVIITDSRDSFKALSEINQKVIESQQRYYMLVQEKEQEIRSIRHEMKNHLTCINGLYKQGNLEELGQYIRQLIEQAEALNDLFHTGNDIVDAILNDADSRYRKEGIGIRLEGAFPPDLAINSMDLCVILANAVNNAVEALQKIQRLPEQMDDIDIKISSFKDDLFIDVSNPVYEKVDLMFGDLNTTKIDKASHGFGTRNMRQCVEKYQGTLQFKSDDTSFKVEIHMKNRKPMNKNK